MLILVLLLAGVVVGDLVAVIRLHTHVEQLAAQVRRLRADLGEADGSETEARTT